MREPKEFQGKHRGQLVTMILELQDDRDRRQTVLELSPFACAEIVDPDSDGPFKDGDVRCDQVYFDGLWWDRGTFLKGRVSVMHELASDEGADRSVGD